MNEAKMLNLLPELLPSFGSPITFVELGTNDGFHTGCLYRFLMSTGRPWRLVTLEADPRLKPNIPPGVDFVQAAIAKEDGTANFHLSSGHDEHGTHYTGSSSLHGPTALLKQYWPKMEFNETVAVKTITLDTLCAERGIEHIDFIWCDTQGCEYDAILGAKQMMPRTKWFFTEYADGEIYEGQGTFAQVKSALPDFDVHTDFGGDALLVNKIVPRGTPVVSVQ